MNAVIAVEGLVKRYRRGGWRRERVTALDGVSFTVEPGEAFGFIGPNGAGKSTTIKLLIGAMRADGGTIRLQGLPIENPEARKGLGYVQENPALYDHLTPLEMLLMAMRLHRVEVDDPDGHALAWLDRLSLSASARRSVREFSKGMVQRTAIAVAMAIRPRLLILDEPLSGLDPIGRRDVVDLLAEYKRGGGSLFFTSHVLHDVERLADRFGLIHKGRLRSVRTPAELAENEEGIVVRSQGLEAIAGMAEESRGRWSATVSRGELWSLLEALRTAGHVLIEVRPALNLEAAFMRAVGES